MTGAVVAAAAGGSAAARRRVIARMRERGAVRPNTAQPLPDDLNRPQRHAADRLIRVGVLRQASPGAYFLDESALADYRGRQRAIALSIAIALAGLAAALLLTS